MKTESLHLLSRILLIISGIGLIITIFVPVWSIYLNAPQYPEGLAMFIHANKVSGEYEIINGLNHYIGMKEIHADEFWEFKVLPYALGLLAGRNLEQKKNIVYCYRSVPTFRSWICVRFLALAL